MPEANLFLKARLSQNQEMNIFMTKNIIFILLTALSLLSPTLSASNGATLSSVLASNASNQTEAIRSEPEFLKVDQAFIFESESTDKGLKLSWDIADSYYLYQERFKFKITDDNATLGEAQFSTIGEAKEDPYFGLVHVIHDRVEVFLPIELASGATDTEVKVSYQGCAEAGLCYPPKHQYILHIPSNQASNKPESNSNTAKTQTEVRQSLATDERNLEDASGIFSFIQSSSLPVIVGIFFLLGLGLTFTPCVFPMIPIITSIIAGQEKPTVSKSFVLSVTYVVGMAVTYATAGVITGLLGASANIQAAMQDPYLLTFFAAVFVLLAMAMFGLYELQLPAILRDKLNSTSQRLNGGHLSSVFFIGALSALIVSPCVSAPLAGALLYISSTADAVIGGASLFALGLGMGLPLILIAVGGGKFFPKAGQWMDRVKYLFGIMLIAVAIWLLSRFLPGDITLGLWAILFGLTATQMGAFDPAPAGWPRIAKGIALLLALYTILLTIGAFTGATNPFKPLDNFNQGQKNYAINGQNERSKKVNFEVIYQLSELDQQMTKAKNAGKPMIVDFYADWCISCVVMENEVFPLKEIRSKLNRFHLVKADVTANSTENQTLLNHFGLFGPPSILLFDKQGNENKELRIVGEITKEGFEKRLEQALKD
jgi:thiol:disulfide interchange protein DsbD